MRVQGLPIRDCARGCINRGYMWLQLSAIDVTAKTFLAQDLTNGSRCDSKDVTAKTYLERLYLALGLRKPATQVNSPYAPTTPTIHCTTISRFLCKCFPRMAPQFFCHHDSPSNMAESRYPLCDSAPR